MTHTKKTDNCMLKNAIRSQAQAFLSLRKKLCLVLLCAIQIVCAQSFFISGKISNTKAHKGSANNLISSRWSKRKSCYRE